MRCWYNVDFPSFNAQRSVGSTLTVALSCGWFLTVANLGDTEAIVDTGVDFEMMTQSHRLEECEKERKRLTDAGVRLARLRHDLLGPADKDDIGLGPQRCWPGGLANSRSIGDLDGGQHIVASPHIKQVIQFEVNDQIMTCLFSVCCHIEVVV